MFEPIDVFLEADEVDTFDTATVYHDNYSEWDGYECLLSKIAYRIFWFGFGLFVLFSLTFGLFK